MRRRPPRNPLFSRRRFEDNVIIRCVRWYLRFKLSYRDLAEIAWELGVSGAPCTILRWVVRYSEEFAKRWLHFEQRVGRSWRADETYVKVQGGWMFPYGPKIQFSALKQRLRPMLGLKSFETADIVISGIELAEKIKKGQFKMGKLGGRQTTLPEIWRAMLSA